MILAFIRSTLVRSCVRVLAVVGLTLGGAATARADLQPGKGELIAGTAAPIARFHASYFTDADRVATIALKQPFARGSDLPVAYAVQPKFQKLPNGHHQVVIETAPGTSLYGTGEVAGPLLRNGRSVTLWNSDSYGYSPSTPSLYQSHPWILAVRADGTSFGVLVDTTWRCEINLAGAITVTAEGNPFPVYVIDRASPQDVLKGLAELTGPMPLPPLWAIGYHQCRYSYFPEARVREIAEGFRKRNIPASVIWFDIDYMDAYKVFTFDKTRFPDPKKLNTDLNAQGWKTIWMIDPGVKAEPGYSVFDDMVKNDYDVKQKDGKPFRGPVWPGMCAFPDYTNHDVRAWWAGLYRAFMATGIDGVWNDMNEPAVFDTPTKTMPEDNLHRGGEYRAYPDSPTQIITPGDHTRFHNVYGLLMAQGTYEGIKTTNPDKRPFVLTRAGYLGSHRYAATWTGDNSATWLDLEQSIPMALNLGLSGQPFGGPDIGGFIGNGPNDTETSRAEHFARWMGIGALLPFSRGHTAKGNIDKEPWAFGPVAEEACRLALQRRYRLLPYFYTLFREASINGLPVARPLFFVDPKDQALRSEDDAFLIGDALLVVPQLVPDRTRTVITPRGVWRKVELVNEQSNIHLPELRIRGGTIIPLQPIMQYAGEKPIDPLTLLVCLDDAGKATGTLYEDANDGYGFQKGDYLLSTYTAVREGNTVTVRVSATEGQRARPARNVVVQIVTERGVVEGQGTDGSEIKINLP